MIWTGSTSIKGFITKQLLAGRGVWSHDLGVKGHHAPRCLHSSHYRGNALPDQSLGQSEALLLLGAGPQHQDHLVGTENPQRLQRACSHHHRAHPPQQLPERHCSMTSRWRSEQMSKVSAASLTRPCSTLLSPFVSTEAGKAAYLASLRSALLLFLCSCLYRRWCWRPENSCFSYYGRTECGINPGLNGRLGRFISSPVFSLST